MRDRLVQFGCFYQTRSIVTRLQTGVVRTNCMDSLDRTNVVQSLIAAENLNSVLKNVGILHNNDVIDNHQGNLLKGMDNKNAKGHLISKCPFGVFKSTKKPTKFLRISAPGFNERSTQKKAHN